MILNLHDLMPQANGFIIKIDKGHYGENFQSNPVQDVQNGDVYLYSNTCSRSYGLIEIENYKAKALVRETNSSDLIFDYIRKMCLSREE